jgi:S1-C subfamily serine protease
LKVNLRGLYCRFRCTFTSISNSPSRPELNLYGALALKSGKKEGKKLEKETLYAAIAEASDLEKDALFAKENVVGIATGNKITDEVDTGEPCITVFVTHKVDKGQLRSENIIPDEIKGYKTDVVETGEIFAGPADSPGKEKPMSEELGIEILKQRVRPVMGGFSVGHYKITAGTIATCVYDLKPFPGIPKKYYILSNNHVLANSNHANLGDPILQPGPYDGGTVPGDIVARLSRYIPIKFRTPTYVPLNYVDAAIAEGNFHKLNRDIYWIGIVQQVKSNPKVGDIVEKTGRTTNFTTGKIIALHATVDVNYGGGRVARFTDQIVTSNMSAPGDSGSLVCDIKEGAVGLLFAGSSQVTIVNNILRVQSLLGIRLHP